MRGLAGQLVSRALAGALITLGFWGGRAAAQERQLPGDVDGVVADSATGSGIGGARVQAVAEGVEVTADSVGGFRIRARPADTLLVRAVGYSPKRIIVGATGVPVRVALAPVVRVLGDLVVTASRRPERAAETAVNVTSVSGTEIAAVGAASTDRVLQDIPGLQILPTAPTGSDLSIRGINGPRVLVLIDGEPIPGGLLENRDLSRLSTIAIDRIEIVKGPLSAIYGSDALGGIVNLVTRDPSGPLAIEAQARAGDLGRKELQIGAAAGGSFSYRVDGSWREQTAVASIEPSPGALSRVWDLRSTVRWAATGSFVVRGDLALLRERQRWQVSSDGFNGFNDNRGITGWVEGSWFGSRSSLRGRLVYEDYSHRFRQARASQPLRSDNTPAQWERMVKGMVAWNHRVGAHSVDVGVDATRRQIDSPGKLAGEPSDEEVDWYVQDGWTVGDLLIQPAARVSWNSRWGTALTPSLATAWDLRPGVRLRFNVGRGFRGPSFKELAWDYPNVAAGYVIRGNPDLVPERSWQLALGGSWAAADGLVVDGEVYRNEIRNLIELMDAGADPATSLLLFSTRNVARARTEGAEATVRWTGDVWQVSGGYGLLRARDLATGAQLERRARHQGRFGLGRSFGAKRRVQANVSLVYTGSAPATLAGGVASRQEAFLAAAGQLRVDVSSGLSLSAGVDNALDARPDNWTGLMGRRVYFGVRTRLVP